MRNWIYRLFAGKVRRQKWRTAGPALALAQDPLRRAWTRYYRGNFQAALDQFLAIAAGAADEVQASQACFGAGLCLEDLRRPAEGRLVFEDFVDRYPGSGFRDLAEQGLLRCRTTLCRHQSLGIPPTSQLEESVEHPSISTQE